MSVPAQDTSPRDRSQSTAASTPLHTLLEHLRRITGVELGWRGVEAPPIPAPTHGPVQVDGSYAGALIAPSEALSAGALEAASILAGEWLAREREITELADEVLRGYEQLQLARRISQSLAGNHHDERRLCETVLYEVARLLGARTASVTLRCAAGREERSWSVRAENGAAGKQATGEWLEVPILEPRAGTQAEQIGTLRLEQGRCNPAGYGESERKMARALAAQIAIFLRVGRLVEEARCGGRASREREMTREAHASLLPREEPRIPGVEVAGACLPAEKVGGDHYGYVMTQPAFLSAMVAEVSKTGLRATMAMAGVRSLLHAEAARNDSPADALRHVNRALSRDLQPTGLFATAFLARYDVRERRLRYAGAGHPAALLWRSGEGRFERLERGGLAMGIFEDVVYEQGECDLLPGDVLVTFTDGLTETRNSSGEYFSLERLCHEIMVHRNERPRTLMYRLLEAVERFRFSQEQHDDLTLVILKGTKEKP